MNGSLVLVKVDNIEISIKTAVDASMNPLVFKPMVQTPDPERTIKGWRISTVYPESKHIIIKIKNDFWLGMSVFVPIMNQIIE
jgi:hypothetical protein